MGSIEKEHGIMVESLEINLPTLRIQGQGDQLTKIAKALEVTVNDLIN